MFIDNITLRVDELAARVEATSPAGTIDEQRRLYLSLDKEVDALEDEIDLPEDNGLLLHLRGCRDARKTKWKTPAKRQEKPWSR